MRQYENQVEHMEINGLNVFIMQDTSGDSNPREWCNTGTMVCFHRRYKLGDQHGFLTPDEFVDYWKAHGGNGTILPLYLYDHGGITMSTSPFSCTWDSGQVGWIYVTEDDQQKYGIKDPQALLENEVSVYDQYIRGEVYGFSVEDKDGEIIDCSWGYIGIDRVREEARWVAEGATQPRRTAP